MRDEVWRHIDHHWDMVVVGGGVTGAGILREAVRAGLRVLLVEQRDYAWGTSSRSSKLVHGGLRYLASGQLGLAWESVREREQLLDDAPGLIEPLGFLMASPRRLSYQAGLALYDLLARQWSHRYFRPDEFAMLAPNISKTDLHGGFRYNDAQTDDARLVLRLIFEAVAQGGQAINYVAAENLVWAGDQVVGVELCDVLTGERAEVRATVVVNATGAWADRLREQVGAEARLRPLRGSHLIFPAWRVPVAQALTVMHPLDGRPVFVFPWEGVTLVGTTDIDHESLLDDEPGISPQEASYLLAAVNHVFPSLHITPADAISAYAGVRPVIGSGKADPSKESRDYGLWEENGLLTVTGGKLTTFRSIARKVLKAVSERFPELEPVDPATPALDPVTVDLPRRLTGRYGDQAQALLGQAQTGELNPIPGTHTCWAELRWAAKHEQVVHLDDLLLRRTRLGLLLSNGGEAVIERIRAICQPELGWDDDRWAAELERYRTIWRRCYSLPDDIPECDIAPPVVRDTRRYLPWILVTVGLLLVLWRLRRITVKY